MTLIETYIILLVVCTAVGLLFSKTSVPTPLILVMVGMLLSFMPGFPPISLRPELVLDVFLPLLVYPASTDLPWRDVKQNLRPIVLLSVGHVLFIAVLVAYVVHTLIPDLGWPMCFVMGAVIAPPDDLAILAIADKIRLPYRVITILKAESLLNDATALILFRFSLATLITEVFSPSNAVLAFFLVVIGETLYGFIVGHAMGQLRIRIQDPMLQMMASLITPFIAYLPAVKMGGSGVLATVITGFVIGHSYIEKFPPDIRLSSRAVWLALSFVLQSLLFLLVGLNLHLTLQGIATLSWHSITYYCTTIVLTVIIGRFIWVYPATYLPRFLFPTIRKKDPYPPWQQPFMISWAGMRGVISLAAALAVPTLPTMIEGANPKDLLVFLVFAVITATLLIQGLSLPAMIKLLGLNKTGRQECYDEHLSEMTARLKIAKTVLRWLEKYKYEVKDNPDLYEKTQLRIREYQLRIQRLETSLTNHSDQEKHDTLQEFRESSRLSALINEIERHELLRLWRENKISFDVKTKLLQQLDHHYKRFAE